MSSYIVDAIAIGDDYALLRFSGSIALSHNKQARVTQGHQTLGDAILVNLSPYVVNWGNIPQNMTAWDFQIKSEFQFTTAGSTLSVDPTDDSFLFASASEDAMTLVTCGWASKMILALDMCESADKQFIFLFHEPDPEEVYTLQTRLDSVLTEKYGADALENMFSKHKFVLVRTSGKHLAVCDAATLTRMEWTSSLPQLSIFDRFSLITPCISVQDLGRCLSIAFGKYTKVSANAIASRTIKEQSLCIPEELKSFKHASANVTSLSVGSNSKTIKFKVNCNISKEWFITIMTKSFDLKQCRERSHSKEASALLRTILMTIRQPFDPQLILDMNQRDVSAHDECLVKIWDACISDGNAKWQSAVSDKSSKTNALKRRLGEEMPPPPPVRSSVLMRNHSCLPELA